MGLFDKICKFGKSVWEGTKTVATKAVEYTAKATKVIGETLVDVADAISDALSSLGKKKTPPPKFDPPFGDDLPGDPPGGKGKQKSNEEKEKKRIQREAEAIAKYQEKVATQAEERESDVKFAYLKLYSKYVRDFSEVLDRDLIKEIEDFIKGKSEIFNNTMKKEVNTLVSPSYNPWKRLIKNHPTEDQLQNYCDKAFKDADNNLLDLLQSAIEDTNKFISKCIIKYNNDEAKALKEMKDSLVKLTADEETKAQELKKIAEELAVAQFIANETSLDIQ